MEQTRKLMVYLAFMAILIFGVLYYAKPHHKPCPVCDHSIAAEGQTTESPIANFKKQ